jgi:hypothetical protein
MININPQDLMGGPCEGLCLHLDAEQLKALGLDKHPLADGATVTLRATATVKHAATADDADNEAEEGGVPEDKEAGEKQPGGLTLELHLAGMHVAQSGRAPAKVLYGAE